MTTTTVTAEQLAALDAAIASPVERVRHADRDVTYRSVEDLLRARGSLTNEAAEAAGVTRHTRSYASFSKV